MSELNSGFGRILSRCGRLALMPVDAFAAGSEMFAQAARGFHGLAGESYDTVSGRLAGGLIPVGTGSSGVSAAQDLADSMVKLVEYAVVSIHSGRERVLESEQLLVARSMSREAFAAWRIADYLQRGGKQQIEPADREFLRVCFQVLDRWSAEQD